jgi:PAS domain S-box-containing protein
VTEIDYHRIFRSSPAILLLLRADGDFTIADASDAYLREALTVREKVVGRPLFEIFPDNPDDPEARGTANLRASFARVLQSGTADVMPALKYDVRRPRQLGGGFEQRWWSLVNAPVMSAEGKVELILLRAADATERARSERDLRATEILDSITEGFLALDREWRFTYVNRQAKRILGGESESLLGRDIWEAYPGLRGTGFEGVYREAMEGKASSITAFYPDHQRWYEAHAYPTPTGVSIYFRDVSEQKQAEAERQRLAAESDRGRRIYEAALSNTPDLVYIFDLDHRFVYANEALLAMWGIPREQALGKTTHELGYPEWEADMHDRELDQVIATKRPIRGEVPFVGTGGRRVWDYIFAPVLGPEGEVVAIAGTARDTTERRQAEESIAEQSVRLQEADRAKDEFIATLSHELRNPLAPLRSAVALLRRAVDVDAGTARLHQMMERQVDHLVRLVDDLLEISRVSRGDFVLRKERVQLSGVVRNALETSEPVLHARRHRLGVSLAEEAIWVDADPVRLAQVVANLVDNAAKYTPPGGRVEVSVAREDDRALVRVRDNGVGIAPESRHRIFEMFNRGDRGSVDGEGGLGIGLALARQLAEMHGASLEAASEGLGKGSEFTLRLPVAPSPPAAGAARRDDAAGMVSKRILVVDDNRDAAESLGMILRELGAEVRVAHDGREALEIFPQFDPAAVLLDIGMPEMDGYEVARTLRRRFPERRTPLIALTGWGQQEDRARAREAGFDHHIVKPAEIDKLQALLASVPQPGGQAAVGAEPGSGA